MVSVDYVVLTLEYVREDDVWVGVCKESQNSTYADTLDEYQTKMTEMMVDVFDWLVEADGLLEANLKRWGLKVYSAGPADQGLGIPDALVNAVRDHEVMDWPRQQWFAAAFQSCDWPLFQPCIIPLSTVDPTGSTERSG